MPEDILNKVISFISGGDSEAVSDKDVLLKQIAKEITQNKYSKFYRVKQKEADSSLAQFFFSIYGIVYPLQQFLRNPAIDAKVRQITLESFLDRHVMDIVRKLSPEAIGERKRSAGSDFTKQLQEDINALASGFDSPKIAAADSCYNLIASMKQFVAFNFFALLKKFDPGIPEGNFQNQPKFECVEAAFIVPEITSFLSLVPVPNEGDNWKTVFEILKYCNGGTDVISPSRWDALLAALADLNNSQILKLMCRLAADNPILDVKPDIPHETLSASYLEQKTSEVREVISAIAADQKNIQIRALENAVFASSEVSRLHFYTVEKEKVLLDKNLDGFAYAPALNHLLSFIQDFLQREIHELCEILLIRGQWTNNAASRQMSDGYHNAMEITGEIKALDETLDEDGSNGARLRGALLRVDRDKTQSRYIGSIVSGINEEALNIINRTVSSLIIVGKHLKMLMEDCEKKHSELVMNWKELGLVSKTPIPQRITAAYKKINYFVQLMILETRDVEN